MKPIEFNCGIARKEVTVEFNIVGYTTGVRCQYFKKDKCKLISEECPVLNMVGKGHKPSLYGK